MIDPMEMSLLKECRDLDNALTKRKKELQSLSQSLSWGDMSTNRPKRYSIDLDFISLPRETSLTVNLTRSQPRSLLSSARLNNARSLILESISRSIRIPQICSGLKGSFCPTNLPLFQGILFILCF